MTTVVRSATPADAEAAARIVRASIAELCVTDHKGDKALLDAWLANKTPENFAVWISAPGAQAFIAEENAEPVGFALLTSYGELALLYVLPARARTGIGKVLMDSVRTAAALAGFRSIQLESTTTARDFYLAQGFEASAPPSSDWGMLAHPMRQHLVERQS